MPTKTVMVKMPSKIVNEIDRFVKKGLPLQLISKLYEMLDAIIRR